MWRACAACVCAVCTLGLGGSELAELSDDDTPRSNTRALLGAKHIRFECAGGGQSWAGYMAMRAHCHSWARVDSGHRLRVGVRVERLAHLAARVGQGGDDQQRHLRRGARGVGHVEHERGRGIGLGRGQHVHRLTQLLALPNENENENEKRKAKQQIRKEKCRGAER